MNPYAKAVALKYTQNSDPAPKVIASGRGLVAANIIAKAKEYDIPLFQNELLADSLLGLDINESIPPALYGAVVEVFAWLMESEQKAAFSN